MNDENKNETTKDNKSVEKQKKKKFLDEEKSQKELFKLLGEQYCEFIEENPDEIEGITSKKELFEVFLEHKGGKDNILEKINKDLDGDLRFEHISDFKVNYRKIDKVAEEKINDNFSKKTQTYIVKAYNNKFKKLLQNKANNLSVKELDEDVIDVLFDDDKFENEILNTLNNQSVLKTYLNQIEKLINNLDNSKKGVLKNILNDFEISNKDIIKQISVDISMQELVGKKLKKIKKDNNEIYKTINDLVKHEFADSFEQGQIAFEDQLRNLEGIFNIPEFSSKAVGLKNVLFYDLINDISDNDLISLIEKLNDNPDEFDKSDLTNLFEKLKDNVDSFDKEFENKYGSYINMMNTILNKDKSLNDLDSTNKQYILNFYAEEWLDKKMDDIVNYFSTFETDSNKKSTFQNNLRDKLKDFKNGFFDLSKDNKIDLVNGEIKFNILFEDKEVDNINDWGDIKNISNMLKIEIQNLADDSLEDTFYEWFGLKGLSFKCRDEQITEYDKIKLDIDGSSFEGYLSEEWNPSTGSYEYVLYDAPRFTVGTNKIRIKGNDFIAGDDINSIEKQKSGLQLSGGNLNRLLSLYLFDYLGNNLSDDTQRQTVQKIQKDEIKTGLDDMELKSDSSQQSEIQNENESKINWAENENEILSKMSGEEKLGKIKPGLNIYVPVKPAGKSGKYYYVNLKILDVDKEKNQIDINLYSLDCDIDHNITHSIDRLNQLLSEHILSKSNYFKIKPLKDQSDFIDYFALKKTDSNKKSKNFDIPNDMKKSSIDQFAKYKLENNELVDADGNNYNYLVKKGSYYDDEAKKSKKYLNSWEVKYKDQKVILKGIDSSRSQEMSYSDFIVFLLNKEPEFMTEKEYNNEKKPEQKETSGQQGWNMRWFSIGAMLEVGKNITQYAKNYADNKNNKMAVDLYASLMGDSFLSEFIPVGLKSEALSRRDNKRWQQIQKHKKEVDAEEGRSAGSAYKTIQEEIFDSMNAKGANNKLKAAGYFIYAVEKLGLYIDVGDMGSKSGQGLWVKALFGQKAQKEFMNEVKDLQKELESDPKNFENGQDIAKLETEFIFTKLSNSSKEYSKVYGTKFKSWLDGKKDSIYNFENHSDVDKELASKDFNHIYDDYKEAIQLKDTGRTLGAIKTLNGKGIGQYDKVTYAMLAPLFGNFFCNNTGIDTLRPYKNICSSYGFKLGKLGAKSGFDKTQLVETIDAAASQCIDDHKYGDFKKALGPGNQPWSKNHATKINGPKNLQEIMENFESWWRSDGKGEKVMEYLNNSNIGGSGSSILEDIKTDSFDDGENGNKIKSRLSNYYEKYVEKRDIEQTASQRSVVPKHFDSFRKNIWNMPANFAGEFLLNSSGGTFPDKEREIAKGSRGIISSKLDALTEKTEVQDYEYQLVLDSFLRWFATWDDVGTKKVVNMFETIATTNEKIDKGLLNDVDGMKFNKSKYTDTELQQKKYDSRLKGLKTNDLNSTLRILKLQFGGLMKDSSNPYIKRGFNKFLRFFVKHTHGKSEYFEKTGDHEGLFIQRVESVLSDQVGEFDYTKPKNRN